MLQHKRLLTVGFVAILLLCSVVVFIKNRSVIIELIQETALELRTRPYSSLLLSFFIALTSIPPLIGFTFITTLTGFIYGFPGGVLPAVCGAFVGATVAFGLIRQFNFQIMRFSNSKQEKFIAIQEAIEQGGFKMRMLIRLSPIPWPITNMMLSLLPTITFDQFMTVTAISSFKVSLEVWVGSQLADLSNPDLPASTHRITMITMGCSVFILVVVAWWLYRLTMQKVEMIQKSGRLAMYRKDDIEEISLVDTTTVSSPSKKQM